MTSSPSPERGDWTSPRFSNLTSSLRVEGGAHLAGEEVVEACEGDLDWTELCEGDLITFLWRQERK